MKKFILELLESKYCLLMSGQMIVCCFCGFFMSLFDQILGALDNPQQEASSNQLEGILNTVQQLSSSYQTNPTAVQSAMSIVGNYTRSALRKKCSTQGEQQAQQMINQFGGTQPSTQAVQMLFSAPQIQQIVQEVGSKTGINSQTVQRMLPILVPLVLNLLKTGTNSQNPLGSNSVLSGFLDADGDGDVDIADAMQMATRYLNR